MSFAYPEERIFITSSVSLEVLTRERYDAYFLKAKETFSLNLNPVVT